MLHYLFSKQLRILCALAFVGATAFGGYAPFAHAAVTLPSWSAFSFPSCSIKVAPASITQGQSTTLTWSTKNASSATLSPSVGIVATSGSLVLSPSASTQYILTVRGSGRYANSTARCSAYVRVSAPVVPAPTCTLTALPTTIEKGQSSTLTLASTNSISASLNQGIGTVGTTSVTNVAPTVTTSYTATVQNAAGKQATCRASVNVTTPPPPPPPQTEGNLVTNGTFESASADPTLPQGWEQGGWGTNDRTYSYPVAGDGSARAVQVSMTAHTNGDVKWFFTPVPVTPGATYTYRDRYQATVPTNLTIEYTKNGGAKEYVWLGDAESSSAWKTFSGSFTVPAGMVAATVFHILAQPGTLTIDNVELTQNTNTSGDGSFSEGMVSLVFDDGLTSQNVHAVPMLNGAGLKATFAIITDIPHRGYDGYMTWEEIGALRDQGHEIGGHSRTHAHLTQISGAAQDSEIQGSYDDLVAHGFNPQTFVYPYGEQNVTVREKVAQAGYKGARGVYLGYNGIDADKYLLSDQHIESATTVAEAKAHIDVARAQKKWLIFELHEQSANAGQYANDPAVLQGIVDHLKSTNTRVVTLAEGVALID